IEKFAEVYLGKDHSIRELARAVFTSDEFFSQRARFALVKTPVEYVVGAIKMLGVRHVSGTSETDPHLLEFFTILLGQELFNPPDVAGWDLNLGWVDTARMLNRFTYADFLAINRPNGRNAPGLYLDHEQLRRHTKANPKKTVKSFLSLLGPLKIDSATRKALIDYLNSGPGGSTVKFVNDDSTIDKKVRGLVHLIMCLSEFQLN
ncbi:MAG TPA: DUF1800 family protein, partial [Blastocatellia bacterium]|nr:DUF1800 family protein [Blastocatellia bacterium]